MSLFINRCVLCNVILFSRVEVTNHIHSKHELELKKVFSKEVSGLVPFHKKYLSFGLKKIMSSTYWLQGVVKCPTRLKKRASNENEDGAYFIIIGHTPGRRGQLATFFSVRFITIFTRLFVQGVLVVKLGLVVNITWFNIFASFFLMRDSNAPMSVAWLGLDYNF